jgi:ligand-binding sensor domain-containing protein
MNGKIYFRAMNKYCLRIYSHMFLLAALSFNVYTVHAQMKMKKTLGSNEFQNVHYSLQDRAGNLWFGTTGEGVYRYDGKSFSNFTTKDGLSHNSVFCILVDRVGNLWFGSRNNGLTRYDGKSFTLLSE